jgi:single-strand DNA-binding protein
MNQIILEGTCVRDAETKEISTGKVTTVQIASARYYRNADGENVEEVSYFDVLLYGKLADFAEERCRKGRVIRVVGRMKQERWKDDSGKTHAKIVVIAEHIEFKRTTETEEEK